jgi:hypothetical protein
MDTLASQNGCQADGDEAFGMWRAGSLMRCGRREEVAHVSKQIDYGRATLAQTDKTLAPKRQEVEVCNMR